MGWLAAIPTILSSAASLCACLVVLRNVSKTRIDREVTDRMQANSVKQLTGKVEKIEAWMPRIEAKVNRIEFKIDRRGRQT